MATRLTRHRSWPADAKITVAVLAVIFVVVAGISGSTDDHRAALVAPATASSEVVETTASTTDPALTPSTGAPRTSTTGTTIAATTTVPTTGPPSTSGPLRLLATLVVAAPGLGGYQRRLFGDGWAYDGSTGCSVRERVLIDEALGPPAVGPRCAPQSGRWLSIYDGRVLTSPTQLQIDHLVPLGNAWVAGAASWSPQRRLQFANDLASPDTLIAVSGSSNGSKGDRTPDEWLPPNRAAWCTYVTRWVRVKARWKLTVTSSERATLAQVLADCH